jgi:hypothetical protein
MLLARVTLEKRVGLCHGRSAMATKTKVQSKSAFVRDFIGKNPTANRKAVEDAWRKAGHEGPISGALVSTLRRKLGLIDSPSSGPESARGDGARESARQPKRRKRRRRARASGMVAAPAMERQPRSGGRDSAIAEIERDIDRLIFKLMGVGGMEGIEDELRKARRLLYRSISE